MMTDDTKPEGTIPSAPPTGANHSAKTAVASARDPGDTSPLLSRRVWLGLSWGAFSAASAVALGATGRFMFPNVINEPPQQFKAGFPNEYGIGVDERWKEKFGIWIVRTPEDPEQQASGIYALITVCTHPVALEERPLSVFLKPQTPHVAGNTPLARVA